LAGQRRGFISSLLQQKSIPHNERRSKVLHYPAATIFDVVSDVANYQHFLPYITKSQIVTQSREFGNDGRRTFDARMAFGFKFLNDEFLSRVEVVPNRYVVAKCVESDSMENMTTLWTFTPRGEDQTEVILRVDMDIFDPLKAGVIAQFFSHMADAQMEAFEREIARRNEKMTSMA